MHIPETRISIARHALHVQQSTENLKSENFEFSESGNK